MEPELHTYTYNEGDWERALKQHTDAITLASDIWRSVATLTGRTIAIGSLWIMLMAQSTVGFTMSVDGGEEREYRVAREDMTTAYLATVVNEAASG